MSNLKTNKISISQGIHLEFNLIKLEFQFWISSLESQNLLAILNILIIEFMFIYNS